MESMTVCLRVCKSLEAEGANPWLEKGNCDLDLPETTTVTRMLTLIGPKPVTVTTFYFQDVGDTLEGGWGQ